MNYWRIAVLSRAESAVSTLKPSSLASVKVNYWRIAVCQGLKVPSPEIFAYHSLGPKYYQLIYRTYLQGCYKIGWLTATLSSSYQLVVEGSQLLAVNYS